MEFLNKMKHWLGFDEAGFGADFRFERYLAQSTDVIDLENRMKQWDRMSDAEKNRW